MHAKLTRWTEGLLATLCCGVAAPAMAGSALCDESLRKAFASDRLTKIVLVRPFAAGQRLALGDASAASAPVAVNDLCLVKIIVGPGNPGPAGAPSTSAGIGIEIWLPSPAKWNGRIHAIGGGGWVGGAAGSPSEIGSLGAAGVADAEGAVSSTTDTGHAGPDGAFGLKPDGSINTALWRDFATRSLDQQALKTKALTTYYYGRKALHSYWEGGSQGGRQGLSLAQNFPKHYDGIIASFPAINLTRLLVAAMYPQIVFHQDLGGVALSMAQQDMVSRAAIAVCGKTGGEQLGYVMDPAACRYDPVKDTTILCGADGGANDLPDCLTKRQATAVNKIWYGMTADGSVPDPAVDNGWDSIAAGNRKWFGLQRGTSLYDRTFIDKFGRSNGLTVPDEPFKTAAHFLAVLLGDSKIADGSFRNAISNGKDGWKNLDYTALSAIFEKGLALDGQLGGLNTDNPDLSAFKKRGGKILSWHGLADEIIPAQGTIRYYQSVMQAMGGAAAAQSFFKFYLVPGNGHNSQNGTANPAATPPVIEWPYFYQLMVDWVEKGVEPGRLDISSPRGAAVPVSQPVCPYPMKPKYRSGDPRIATSYECAG